MEFGDSSSHVDSPSNERQACEPISSSLAQQGQNQDGKDPSPVVSDDKAIIVISGDDKASPLSSPNPACPAYHFASLSMASLSSPTQDRRRLQQWTPPPRSASASLLAGLKALHLQGKSYYNTIATAVMTPGSNKPSSPAAAAALRQVRTYQLSNI